MDTDDEIIAAAQRKLEANRAEWRAEQARDAKAAPPAPAAQPMRSAMTSLARVLPPPDRSVVQAALTAAASRGGGVLPAPSGTRFACAGIEGCAEPVTTREGLCPRCAVELPRRARAERIANVREALSPGGIHDFCKPGHPLYVKTTALAREAAARLDAEHRGAALAVIEKAAWLRETGGIAILGPTGIGKSKVLVAVGLRIIAAAEERQSDAAMFSFATGIRYVNGIKLARDARASKLGAVDAAFQAARNASLLLFDEVGFEDGRIDPLLVRDVLRDRYEPYKPTILASGATLEALNDRYGAAAIRGIWERGHLVDLHNPNARAAR